MNSSEIKEEVIFNVARQMTDSEVRAAYLEQACGTDHHLRKRVTSLVSIFLEDSCFLECPVSIIDENDVGEPISEAPGAVIGPYQLLEQIGAGGMGLVFKAEQLWPVQRTVALKIIKPGMDSQQVIGRFEAERQVLAMMNHPNIARMLDAGTTDSGRPYFVMELVHGIPITQHCDEARLQTSDRLKLFIAVCEGVLHAHQNGIIHRDIKPANVLVTLQDGKAIPKVIDFGIAKAMTQRVVEWTLHSNTLQMVGTPVYMSPEQAQLGGSDVDTRSDIYSLGVLLYELLTGSSPFDRKRLYEIGYDEMRRVIREEEPPRPSVRVTELRTSWQSTIVADSKVTPRQFRRSLRDDLDWVVMKTLEKDRNRRYESVSALVADIKRYLSDEPVEARRPSAWYRMRKFARRRKSLFIVLSIIAAFVSIATGELIVSYVLIARERAEMLKQRDIAQEHEKNIIAKETTIHGYLYAADMQLAYRAYFKGDLRQAHEKLQSHRGSEGDVDRRGFEWHLLSRMSEDSYRICHGHTQNVFDVTFSPDGKTLATSSGDFSLMFWNVKDGTRQSAIHQFKDDVNSTNFSLDGNFFATAEEGLMARVWDTRTHQEVARLVGFELPVAQACFTDDPNILVTTESEWKVFTANMSTWNRSTERRVKTVNGFRMLAVNTTGDQLVAVNADGQVSIWKLPELEQQSIWTEHHKQIYCGQISRDGRFLATGSHDGTVRLWTIGQDISRQLPNFDPHRPSIRGLAFSPDHRFLAVADDDGVTTFWDVESLTIQKVIHSPGQNWSADISPDGLTLGLGRLNGVVQLHDLSDLPQTRRRIFRSNAELHAAAIDSSGRRFALISGDRTTASIIDGEDGTLLQTLTSPDSNKLEALAFAADHDSIWIGNGVGDLLRFSIVTGQCVKTIPLRKDRVTGLFSSANHRFLAMESSDNPSVGAKIWDTETSQLRFSLPRNVLNPHEGIHTIRAFMNQSTTLTSEGRTGMRWNVETGEEIGPRFPHDQWVHSMAISPDEQTVAISLDDAAIHLWDVPSGQKRAVLLGHNHIAGAFAFSSDGRTLASASISGEVKLWHLPTAQPLCDLPGTTGIIFHLSFSTDGKCLRAAARTSTQGTEIMVWDARNSGPAHNSQDSR
jgi:WD40 repeat protein/serine/threonine protein kinase